VRVLEGEALGPAVAGVREAGLERGWVVEVVQVRRRAPAPRLGAW